MNYFVAGLNEQELARDICKNLKGRMLKREISYFTGGELDINIEDKDLSNKTIYIIQSIFNNANDRAMELFLLVEAVKNLGGRDIIAIIPYLGYSRQDKLNRGSAFSLQCLAKLIKASGIKKIITVDLHNSQSVYLFDLPVINLTTALIFKDAIKNRDNAVLVAPDVGATLRTQTLANLLNVKFIIAQKERTKSGKIKIIDIPDIETITGKDCYLVDDILDTGKTICSVALELEKFNPRTIYALISHGLFSNGATQAIDESCIKKICITDSVNCSLTKSSKICTVELSSIIADFLKNNKEQN